MAMRAVVLSGVGAHQHHQHLVQQPQPHFVHVAAPYACSDHPYQHAATQQPPARASPRRLCAPASATPPDAAVASVAIDLHTAAVGPLSLPPLPSLAQHQTTHSNILPSPRRTKAPVQQAKHGSLGWPTGFQQNYKLHELLGSGSYGKVWLASPLSGGSHFVAVKVIAKHRDDRAAQDHLHAIQREARNWMLCHSSHYVARLDAMFEDDENAYLVQELCCGGDVKTLLKEGPLTELEAAHIMRAVFDVLFECHSHHMIYGDIKPANFMLKQPYGRAIQACEQQNVDSITIQGSSSSGSSSNEVVLEVPRRVASTDGQADVGAGAIGLNSIPFASSSGSWSGEPPVADACQAICGAPLASSSTTPSTSGGGTRNSMTNSSSQCHILCSHSSSLELSVRAVDFGCSLDLRDKQAMRHVKCMGSRVYMSAEAWNATYGPWVDMWAAGVMLFQLLTGRYPFWDLSPEEFDRSMPTDHQILIATSGPIHMGDEWLRLSRPARDLIERLLDKNAASRISAGEALQHRWFHHTLGSSPLPTSHAGMLDSPPTDDEGGLFVLGSRE